MQDVTWPVVAFAAVLLLGFMGVLWVLTRTPVIPSSPKYSERLSERLKRVSNKYTWKNIGANYSWISSADGKIKITFTGPDGKVIEKEYANQADFDKNATPEEKAAVDKFHKSMDELRASMDKMREDLKRTQEELLRSLRTPNNGK